MNKVLLLICFILAGSTTLSFAQSDPILGRASSFGILASTEVNNTTTETSGVEGNLGIYPGEVINGEEKLYVSGRKERANEFTKTAQLHARNAYNSLRNLPRTSSLSPALGKGQTIKPGVYHIDGDATLNGVLVLDGEGDINSKFIFIIDGSFNTTSPSLPNPTPSLVSQKGAEAKNVYWVVQNEVGIGVSTSFVGNIIAQNNITLNRGANLEGRAISLTGSVNLNFNTVYLPIVIESDLSISKAVDNKEPELGTNIVYTITTTNKGPGAAFGVVVKENIPAGLEFISAAPQKGTFDLETQTWTIGELANQEVVKMSIVFRVTRSGAINNTVDLGSDNPDPNPSDNNDADPVQVPVVYSNLKISKVADNKAPTIGTQIAYTITARNEGPGHAFGVTVKENVPNGLEYISATTGKGSFDPTTNIWTVGELADQEEVTMTIIFRVMIPGAIRNTVVIDGENPDPDPTDNEEEAPVDVPEISSDLSVTKTASEGPHLVGDEVTYTIVATNTGPYASSNVLVTEQFPSALGFVSASTEKGTYNEQEHQWQVGGLANGESATLTVVFKVLAAGNIKNAVAIGGENPDPNPSDNEEEEPIDVPEQSANLSVTKTASAGPFKVGSEVIYTIVAKNDGPYAATGVTVQEQFPADALEFVSASTEKGAFNTSTNTWEIGTMANGEAATLAITFKIKDFGNLKNIVVIGDDGNNPDPDPTDNEGEEPIDVPQPVYNLSVSKTAGAGPYLIGQQVTYKIIASNQGPDAARGVKVQEQFPSALEFVSASTEKGAFNEATSEWEIGDMANGETVELAVTFNIVAAGNIKNIVVIGGEDTDPDPSDNEEEEPIDVPEVSSDLSVTKTASAGPHLVGELVTYTIVAKNNGPYATTDAWVQEQFPATLGFVSASTQKGTYNAQEHKWEIGAMANGETAELIVIFRILAAGNIRNAVAVGSENPDPNPGDNEEEEPIDVPEKAANLSVRKKVAAGPYKVGNEVAYTIEVENKGPYAATGVTVQEQFPADALEFIRASTQKGSFNTTTNMWQVGEMANGETATLTVVFRVKRSGNINNIVVVEDDGENPDPDPTDNEEEEPIDVPCDAPAVPNAIAGPESTCTGTETLTYSIEAVAGASNYVWTVPAGWEILSGEGTISITVKPGANGGTVTVASENTCNTSSTAAISVNIVTPPATVNPIIDNSSVCNGLTYSVEPVAGATSYTWLVPTGFSIVAGQGTTTVIIKADNPDAKGEVTVIPNNANCAGPAASATIDVSLEKGDLNFPKAFSPNGDGTNDTWFVTNLEKYSENEIVIFNRWGSEVYKRKNYKNDWSGNGLEQGTYFYKARVKLCDGVMKEYSGYVTLFR
ncbi:ice-binding family protein [Pontibacter harenae]|uniref:ice-binding family protein n=1 Tax=Pontibacter harenae TaxID=2894083 RepID=UPI001E2D136B|nr:ice-binding family protein [Pontibacter harenae]MCC9166521.1 DUF11 domain-containing protein [Pontibacter harenae]